VDVFKSVVTVELRICRVAKWDIFIDPCSMNGCVLLIGRLERSAEVKVFAESLPSEALQGPLYYSDTNVSNYVVSLLYIRAVNWIVY
jgi:hypothetical protein